jgi:hypothetical protein
MNRLPESLKATCKDLKFVFAAAVLIYATAYVFAVGYLGLAESDFAYPSILAVVAVFFLAMFEGTFEYWLDGKHNIRGLAQLSVITFGPLLFAKLAHLWPGSEVAVWSVWLKFRVSEFLIALLLAEDIAVRIKRKWAVRGSSGFRQMFNPANWGQ